MISISDANEFFILCDIMWDIILLIAGAVLGVIAMKIDDFIKRRGVLKRSKESLSKIPKYNPLKDNIIVLRQWNSHDTLEESNTIISYNEKRVYNLIYPSISCRFISNPSEWEELYSKELIKEEKRTGKISYITALSLDHKDTKKGNKLEIEVSTCDYIAHNVNSKYLSKYPNDWERIKQVLVQGDLNDYFDCSMPGNVFVNFIIINGQTNNVLAIKRSRQELNARNVWGLSGFETMNDISNAPAGSEELKLQGIVYRGLSEELAISREEVSKIAISSLSFVKHLGVMIAALVRLDLEGNNESNDTLKTMTEGTFIQRVLSKSESRYEHEDLRWMPIDLKEMKRYIDNETGFYKEIIQAYDNDGAKWINYAKMQMYQIWYNHDSIDLDLK